MEDTPTENNLVSFDADIPVASDLQPGTPRQPFQEWLEEKWDRQLSYQRVTTEQIIASDTVREAIKSCVKTILRTVPICQETDRALGQIEVALMCLNKAISLHPELKTKEPK